MQNLHYADHNEPQVPALEFALFIRSAVSVERCPMDNQWQWVPIDPLELENEVFSLYYRTPGNSLFFTRSANERGSAFMRREE